MATTLSYPFPNHRTENPEYEKKRNKAEDKENIMNMLGSSLTRRVTN